MLISSISPDRYAKRAVDDLGHVDTRGGKVLRVSENKREYIDAQVPRGCPQDDQDLGR
jgi:hypothetical protein